MNYFIGGISGVGKTYLLNEIVKRDNTFQIIHVSHEMMKRLGVENDYEKLQNLDQDFVLTEYGKYVEKTLREPHDKSLLFDTHFLNLVSGKVTDRTGNWISLFDAILIITAPIDQIYNRITKDHVKRDRKLFPEGLQEAEKIKLLDKYQKQTHNKFIKLKDAYSLPALEIINVEGTVDIAADQFLSFTKTLIER